ncbi:hypothetical protein JCM3765_003644 [Sporobolomyces pararoseus]
MRPPPPLADRRTSLESTTTNATEGEFELVDHHSPLLPLSIKDTYDWNHHDEDYESYHYFEQSPSPSHRKFGSSSSSSSSTLRRHHKLASLFRLATYFIVGCWVLIGVTVFGWTSWWVWTRRQAYSKSVFAFPLQPNPQPVQHLVPPFPNIGVSNVQEELSKRFDSISLPRSTLPTQREEEQVRISKYSSLPSQGPYLFALNLYNSQSVLPTLSNALLFLSNFLGPQNVHISIFENGSTDNTTLALAHLSRGLDYLGVGHTILSDSKKTDWSKVDRIEQLSVFRNVALKPIEQKNFSDVVFINDVHIQGLDALELLWQRREQNADAVCGFDWRETRGIFSKLGKNSIKMYDSWVARSITGNMLRSRLDIWSEARNGVEELFNLEEDRASKKRFDRGLPIPVYSCWNGMIALTAEPFRTTGVNPKVYERNGPILNEGQTMFKPVRQPPRFRSALKSQGECAASECKTLAKDFWSRGYDRWVMIPTVRSTYSPSIYSHPHLLSLMSRAKSFQTSSESALERSDPFFSNKIDWSRPEWKAPKSVVCWDWVRGFHIDLEWLRMKRNKPW